MALTPTGEVLTDNHRRKQVALATTADSEIRRAMSLIDVDNIDATRGRWNDRMVGIVAKYHVVSEQQAAEYLNSYWMVERPGGPTTLIRPGLNVAVAQGVLDAAGPQSLKKRIGKGWPAQSALQAVSRSVQAETRKLILAGGRGVVRESGRADTVAIGYRRVSDGDPCTFCAMLVSRGPAYTSEAAAMFPGGSTDDRYHNNCGCSVEIVYTDWVPTAEEQRYIDAYYTAAEAADAAGEKRTWDTVLHRMRDEGTFKDSPARRSKKTA